MDLTACLSLHLPLKTRRCGGVWVAHSVGCPTSAQVMISQSVGWNPTLGSVLTVQSLKPALESVSLSPCPSPTHTLSLSLSLSLTKINIKKN